MQKLTNCVNQGRSQDCFRAGESSDKISSKVAKHLGSKRLHSEKFTQQKLLKFFKIYIKIAQNFMKFSQTLKKVIKVKKILTNFQIVLLKCKTL